MTVGELKKLLDDYDDALQVILATNPEGYEYSPLELCITHVYEATTQWWGILAPEGSGRVNALVLWPTS